MDREREFEAREREYETRDYESRSAAERESSSAESRPEPVREQPPKPASVSLWHKIFGSPTEPPSSQSEEPASELAMPSDMRDEPRSAGSGFADPHADEQRPLFEETIEEEEEEIYSETSIVEEEEESPSDRPRERSRRRRGGRGRNSEDRPRPRSRDENGEQKPRPTRPRSEVDDDLVDDHFGEDDADELLDNEADENEEGSTAADGNGGRRTTSALQRAIPSWDEAIGFIVDSNMQTRSQRRPPRGGGRENSSRGRGRGRRGS